MYKIGLGVDDDGTLIGLDQIQLDETLKTLNMMASELNAETKIIRRRQCGHEAGPDKWVVELFVRQIPPDCPALQYRVAVLGNVDAGKSTLVGVLTNGELDNGRGKSRLQMFRHPHEITSGRNVFYLSNLFICQKMLGPFAIHSDLERVLSQSTYCGSTRTVRNRRKLSSFGTWPVT